ncbi:hypothetical protein [Mesorhizobium sp.]|uniref:hypothetical protein n=1 Tax=Mesorhizobium sp. TaxID=1871066 RepID=UPI000FE4F4AE|nr:hypothetical protein [Mesorhizobium sp.]RWJ00156.1 MAG: hypothetical protein EOR23_31040 [Mesorhizobium sp.]TIP86294.1 MAG: hypothetical protein E5X58_32865 [Mesorhizobium sp.]
MPTSHDLKGLMKFLARDEWRDSFEEIFDDHFGPVLEAGDMEFEDIAEILGDDWAMTLWGCAFEDFLTQDFEGGNIVDAYLRRRGWKENAQAKAYMNALRTLIMSLYEVSDIVPGKSLMARDLVRGGEPLAVSEGTATKTLKQWDRIAARIVPVMGKNVFAGGLLPFTPQATDALVDSLRRMSGKKNAKKQPIIKDEDLQAAASMFTLSWLFDTLERMMGMPSLQNSDGDELVFHDVRFPLAPGVTQKDIATRVNAIPGMAQENEKFWNWLEEELKSKAKKRGALSLDTTMDNGLRVLGNVELKGRILHLATNSTARAEKGIALIQKALGDFVRTPLTEIRTVEQMMADTPARNQAEATSDIPPEIAEQVVHQFMDRQYRETLDQPVGMLGNKTPRHAAKSAAGRQKVAEWLKYLENQSARQPNPADPMATYSFEWMWHELGVLDLRQ